MSGKSKIATIFISVISLLLGILVIYQIQQNNFYEQLTTTKQLQDWIVSGVKSTIAILYRTNNG
jgi:hypothetical protein